MEKIKKYRKDIIILLICLLVELLLSNFSAISLFLSGADEIELNLDDATVAAKHDDFHYDGKGVFLKEGTIQFDGIETDMKNVCIELSSESGQYVYFTIAFTDDNFAYEGGFDYNNAYVQMYASDRERNYYTFSSYGNVRSVQLSLDETDEEVLVSSVKLNSKPPIHISLFRLVILIGICLIAKHGLWKIKFKKSDSLFIGTVAVMSCVAVFMMLYMMGASNSNIIMLENYPSHNISSEDEYRQLFEAFKKGQLNLDIDYDVSKLELLDNKYDRSERNEADLHGDFWDRAYYDGKFYSYFGAAPVLTVYYPVNFLTGKVPSTYLASGILCVYAIIFISLLYHLIISKFCKDPPLLLVLIGQLTLLFGSVIFAIAAESMFYYMAVLSGIGWMSAFFYFILKAYYENSFKKRIVFLVLTGISVVMIVASRPTLILYSAAAIVPAIYIFLDKNEKFKNKVIYTASIGVPVVIGAVIIMIYNYLRFDNPFEFGFNYQLTVSIAKANTVTLTMLPPAVYHYFFQQPNVTANFPYFEIKTRSLDAYSRYNYLGRTMGIFTYPATWAVGLAPFVFRKEKKFEYSFLFTIAASALVLSFIDMCKAGAHYRYTADILLPIILVSLVFIFDLLERIEKISNKAYITAYVVSTVVLCSTIIIGFLMIFATESHSLMSDFAPVVEFIRSL